MILALFLWCFACKTLTEGRGCAPCAPFSYISAFIHFRTKTTRESRDALMKFIKKTLRKRFHNKYHDSLPLSLSPSPSLSLSLPLSPSLSLSLPLSPSLSSLSLSLSLSLIVLVLKVIIKQRFPMNVPTLYLFKYCTNSLCSTYLCLNHIDSTGSKILQTVININRVFSC